MEKNYHNSKRFYNHLNIKEFISAKTLSNYYPLSSIIRLRMSALLFILLISNFAIAATSITVSSISASQGCFGPAIPVTVTFTKTGSFTSGNVFTAQLSNSAGSFASPVNIGNVTSNSATPINATIPANTPSGSGYLIRVVSSTPGITSGNSLGFTINPSVIPAVSIAISSGTNPTCNGSSVTFTASPVNGGTTPAYQWKINGTNAGTNSSTFATSSLTNGQNVTCVLTSNANCANPATVASNTITMTVNAIPSAPTAGSDSPVCSGSNLNLTASNISGASYSWTGPNGFTSGTKNSSIPGVTTAASGTYSVTATVSGCTSNPGTTAVTVNPSVIPSVTISISSGTNPSCAGSSVTFNASLVNGGSTPSYQWKVNGVNAGTNNSTFTSTSLTNGQIITCDLSSNATCANPATAMSNSITMIINPVVTPSESIAITSGSNPGCAGSSVTFTANPVNGGTTPFYQWKVDGVNAGSNSSTFTTSSLTDGQTVTNVLTSNAGCTSQPTATSNSITMGINPVISPSLSISITSGSNPGCNGSSVTFTASPVNGGSSPSFQWKIDGVNAGTNSSIFLSSSLTDGQAVSCVLTSNAVCVSPATATSNSITMTINPVVTPLISVAISSGTNPECEGSSVTFTSNTVNEGTTPSYQWKINGINAGTNNASFSTSSLNDGDVISCELTSTAACASTASATSNNITMTVNPVIVPSISIYSDLGSTICNGSSVTFTASTTNGGTSPSYQWKINGVNTGTNNFSYSTSTLTNGDVISCVLTSSAICVSSSSVNSNTTTMTVNPTSVPSISISADRSLTICNGTSINFTANPVNGGTSPSFQWKINGTNAGSNSTSFSTSSLTNGDVVSCVLTSNATCTSPSSASSNNMTINVNPTPTVTGSASSASVCFGSNVTLTGGGATSYSWSHGVTDGVSFVPSSTQTYTVTGTSNGCSAAAQVTVAVNNCAGATMLNNTSCGATGLSISSAIFCETVSGATDYEFSISNSGLGYSQIRTKANFAWIRLSSFTGLTYGQTYDVGVKAKVGGVWGPSGSICSISLMPLPSTNLNSFSCGETGLSPTSYLSCNSIPGANQYEFTITNSARGYSQIRSNGAFAYVHLTNFTGLLYGETYNVSVRANVSGEWSPAGSICQISLMSFPSTQLNDTTCGATGLTVSSYINCQPILGSNDYEFTITNTSLGYSQVKSNGAGLAYIHLTKFAGLLDGETYNVSVRSLVSGVWSPPGNVCQITLGSQALAQNSETNRSYSLENSENTNVNVSNEVISASIVYPNPVSRNSVLTIQNLNQTSQLLIISDVTGRIVFEKRWESEKNMEISLSPLNLDPGLYNVSLSNSKNSCYSKIIITK